MTNLDYLRWEWQQYLEVWYFYPLQTLSLYLTTIFFGLAVLHWFELRGAERKGLDSAAAYLRRKLKRDQWAMLGAAIVLLSSLMVTVFWG